MSEAQASSSRDELHRSSARFGGRSWLVQPTSFVRFTACKSRRTLTTVAAPAEFTRRRILGVTLISDLLLDVQDRRSAAHQASQHALRRRPNRVRDALTRRHYEKRIERYRKQEAEIRAMIARLRRLGDHRGVAEGEEILRRRDNDVAHYVQPNPRPDDLCRGVVRVRVPRSGLGTRRLSRGRPRTRALARASSRGGDSGDSDEPEPAGPGDPVGETSRVHLSTVGRRANDRLAANEVGLDGCSRPGGWSK